MLDLLLRLSVLTLLASAGGLLYIYTKMWWQVRQQQSIKTFIQQQLTHVHQRIKSLFDSVKSEHEEIKDLGTFRDWVTESGEDDVTQRKNTYVTMAKLIRKADLALAKEELAAAEQYLVKALAHDPLHNEANRTLALLYLKQEKYSKAELLYATLIENGATDALIFNNLGLCLYQQDKFELAAKAYLRAIEIEPFIAARHVNLALVYQKLGEIRDHLNNLETAAKLEPKNMDYLFLLTEAYLGNGLRDKALEMLDAIFQLEPYNERARDIKRQIYDTL